MVNKIDGIPGQRPQVAGTNQSNKPEHGRTNDSRASPTTHPDQVSLTSAAQLLKELGDTIDASPVIDQQRVNSVKQALADGTYNLNASRIADRLLILDDQL